MDRYMDVANKLNLIFLGESAGVVYWKPNGLKLYENLKSFIREHHQKRGYLEVKSPSLVSNELFIRSGHNEKYKENMFFIEGMNNYSLRPMSCPNHILLYSSEKRSYKELPLSLFEFGDVFRNEPSGSLQVLFRQRQFCQDDSHIFVSQDKLIESIINYLKMAKEVYKELGFEDVQYAISLRPEKRFGSDNLWDMAENSLKEACIKEGIEFDELIGEGAFYGPKIELKVKDKLDRLWQLGTLQLDYVLPERFDLNYINSKDEMERPVILHHAVLGSLERMIGILLESFGVHLPSFLHPYPEVIMAVSEKSLEYAKILSNENNVLLDNSDEPLAKKIRFWKEKGVPKIYVVGEKEFNGYKEEGIKKAVLNSEGKKEDIIFN